MAYFGLNEHRIYKFVKTQALMDLNTTFTVSTSWTSWDDDLYFVRGFGIDSGGFYYSYQTYEYLPDGTKRSTGFHKNYWGVLSGDFMIDFVADTLLDENIYNTSMSVYPIEFQDIDHVTVTMTLSGLDEDFQQVVWPSKISLHLVPDSQYSFNTNNVPVLINYVNNDIILTDNAHSLFECI